MVGRMDELEVGERGRAVVGQERVVALPRRAVRPFVLRAEPVPSARVVRRVAAERRREIRVLHLERVAAHDPHPRRAVGEERRERVDVVLDDHVGLRAIKDRAQLRLAEHRAVHKRCPPGLDERRELFDRGLAELRRGLDHEVGPELPGVLLGAVVWRGSQVHQILLEPERLQTALPGGLRSEDHPMPSPLEDLADADAVVRGPVRALGHEEDRQAVVHVGVRDTTQRRRSRGRFVDSRVDMDADLFLADLEAKPEWLRSLADGLDAAPVWGAVPPGTRRVVLIGMGSSRYAAAVIAARLRASGVHAVAEYASAEAATPGGAGTVAIGISATGKTEETTAALRRHRDAGSAAIALTDAPASAIAVAGTGVLDLTAGPEQGGVACRTFQHTLALLLALEDRLLGHDISRVPSVLRRAADATEDLLARR